jgi:hypothetical protein
MIKPCKPAVKISSIPAANRERLTPSDLLKRSRLSQWMKWVTNNSYCFYCVLFKRLIKLNSESMSNKDEVPEGARKQDRWFLYLLLGVAAFIGILAFLLPQNTTLNKPAPEQSVLTPETTRSTITPDKWEYSSETYGIDNASFKSATINSSSPVSFAFPYNKSNNKGHLTIAKRGKQIQAYLTVDTGQFNSSFSGQPIKVKFDQGKTRAFNGVEPTDHQSGWLFLTDAKGFILALKKAKTVKMEAEFYREGSRVFVFDVAGIDIKRIGL